MKKTELKQYIFIILGSFAMAFGTVCFLSPNEIITGGGVGISLLLHAIFPQITLGIIIAVVSIPFLILSYIYFGKYYLFKTFIVVLLLSTFTDILKEVLKIEAITHDILLAAVFGGIFIGLGVGLVIKGRASTGSTSVVGEIVAKKTKYKAAEVLLAIDATIMFASVFVYNDIDKSLYSMLSVYVGIRVLDITAVYMSPKEITPQFCRSNLGCIFFYNASEWLETHASNDGFKNCQIPDVTLYVPAIYHGTRPTEEQIQEISVENLDPFRAWEISGSGIINGCVLETGIFCVDFDKHFQAAKEKAK
jgi:uncharacterized membrane-anchored protein YitT (DUF2179 family)